jgi:hypothetical protein
MDYLSAFNSLTMSVEELRYKKAGLIHHKLLDMWLLPHHAEAFEKFLKTPIQNMKIPITELLNTPIPKLYWDKFVETGLIDFSEYDFLDYKEGNLTQEKTKEEKVKIFIEPDEEQLKEMERKSRDEKKKKEEAKRKKQQELMKKSREIKKQEVTKRSSKVAMKKKK